MASIEKVPWAPAVLVWAMKCGSLSTSLTVSWPVVERAAAVSASVRSTLADDRTAASLVPRMSMATEVWVPSALRTSKFSR